MAKIKRMMKDGFVEKMKVAGHRRNGSRLDNHEQYRSQPQLPPPEDYEDDRD